MKLGNMLAAIGAMAPASDCARPLRGPHASYIPNVIVHTHLNQRAWFYDDLIAGKTVLIHCMSIADEESCGSMRTLAQVQPLIGDVLGRSVFIYSITTDPIKDTPAALQRIAAKYGAREGWLFLSGAPADLRRVRERLFTHGGGHDCSMSLLRYGNEQVGLWGGTSITSSPESIVERLSWITPQEHVPGPYKRGGPPLLSG